MEENKCIFCQIAAKTIKANIVYEDEILMGVLDINPATNGHVIIMPKNHYNSLYELPQNEYLALLSIARAIAYALVLSMGATNVDLVCTQELRKGTFTPHVLIHAIPRYSEDTVNYVWQPNPLSDEQASEISNAVRDAIEKVKNGGDTNVSYSAPVPQPAQNAVQNAAVPQQQKPPENAAKPESKEEKLRELKKKVVVF